MKQAGMLCFSNLQDKQKYGNDQARQSDSCGVDSNKADPVLVCKFIELSIVDSLMLRPISILQTPLTD